MARPWRGAPGSRSRCPLSSTSACWRRCGARRDGRAATLGAGLTLLQRSLPLAMPWLRLSIDERPDEIEVGFAGGPRFPGRDEADLFTLGLLVRRLQRVPVRATRLSRIDVPLRAPADRQSWSRLVDGTPL